MSGFRKEIRPTSIKLINTQNTNILFFKILNFINRNKPYPPNFNKIAAKIIDPKTGAST
jgi:hypothetical protein